MSQADWAIVQSKIRIVCSTLFSFSDETADDLNARGGGGGPGSKWGLSRHLTSFFHRNGSHYFEAKFIKMVQSKIKKI
jgi:hypothetical protein